MAQRDDAE